MARQPVVAGRAEQLLGSAVVATAPVAGGDISTAVKLRLSSGRSAFLKTLSPAPPQFFAREAAGLRWLAEVLYPDRTGWDLRAETREFYRLFYQVELDDPELDRLLGEVP